ncbi:TetR family transcriptional regulator [Mycobacterium saskatchewanense]|uniref:TetR family transcriptional regulator n=1 Tax=Mycobacterium saskatchewanense TaxID=220927 RepID=A0AAJ3NMT0_9MYCO|nr:TetR/AcrR family transcriptional regulator [Mycobacterium saskatchewanense]ORW69081.1 TetR family transcriptional regulator [Mycobacterium saskatchewanense]BBX61740.1 TetR family transcriptional regulator [Mycobacterium saskatchewanense]
MAIEDRRERERAARRRLIVTTARKLAEDEGWDAVTTRRLSTQIEYSQPVLYKHFTGMEQIADAVALDGFGELAEAIRAARSDGDASDDSLSRIARAYLDFARDNPAVYDAMFTRATGLRFAAQDTPPELTAAFGELHQAVRLVADGRDADTLTEVFWAALHGLVTLSRTGRLRPGYDSERLELLVKQITGGRRATRAAKR